MDFECSNTFQKGWNGLTRGLKRNCWRNITKLIRFTGNRSVTFIQKIILGRESPICIKKLKLVDHFQNIKVLETMLYYEYLIILQLLEKLGLKIDTACL